MRRFVWGLIVVVTCAWAVAFGWRLGSGYDAAIPDPGTATEDSIWIRDWVEEARMQFPDGDGGFREPLGEIDRLQADRDVPGDVTFLDIPDGFMWLSNVSVATRGDSLWLVDATGIVGPITFLDMALRSKGKDALVVGDTTAPILTFADAPPETMRPWAHGDTLWFAEADGKRDIVLHVDGARMKIIGDLEPMYFHGTLYGRLYWTKGEWVFKGQGAK